MKEYPKAGPRRSGRKNRYEQAASGATGGLPRNSHSDVDMEFGEKRAVEAGKRRLANRAPAQEMERGTGEVKGMMIGN